jgi:eukaryotic-like serine/threonine-protein kinase
MQIRTNSKWNILIHLGIMVCIVAIILLSFFFLYLPGTTNHGESVTVPDLTGMNVAQVDEFLRSHDLRYEVNDSTYRLDKSPNIVLTQYPRAGAKVKENRKIYLTKTMLNPPTIEMPKLVGISLRSAQMLLQSFQLQQGELKYVKNLAQNLVLEQHYNGKKIEPGDEIPKGSRIDLVVGDGLGETEFEVPAIVGMSFAEAKVLIEGSDLVLGNVQYSASSDQPSGTVIRQNPTEGKRIRTGELVDVWVSGVAPPTEGNPQ